MVGGTYQVKIGTQTFQHVATAASLTAIAQGLTLEIDNDPTLGATRSGNVITLTGGTSRNAAVSVETVTPSRTIALGGVTVEAYKAYAVRIGTLSPFTVVAAAGETSATLADKLRALIDANATYTATVSGSTISITGGDAKTVNIEVFIAPRVEVNLSGRVSAPYAALGTGTISSANADVNRTVDLSGFNPLVGASYTVTIGAQPFSFTATTATLASVVEGLRGVIDVDSTLAATASGNVLTVTGGASRTAAIQLSTATPARTVSLTGLTVTEGKTYAVRVGSATPFSVNALSGETAETLAEKLRVLIDANADYVAVRTGAVISITSGDSGTVDIDFFESPQIISVTSAGDISLTSTAGLVRENFADDGVDLVADRLTIRAATGITGLEVAVNLLDVETTTGNIQLAESDGAIERTAGMQVLRAVTAVPDT